MMHPKADRRGRRVVTVTVRLLGVLAFCAMLFFEGQAASWATDVPTPATSGQRQELSPSSWLQSSATGWQPRSAWSSTSGSSTGSAGSAGPRSAATADPAPTADQVRTEFHDLAPVVLLGFAVLAATNVATLLVLIGKK
jgi:hypothetical protein